jgi:PAS domain S-box-containing protein
MSSREEIAADDHALLDALFARAPVGLSLLDEELRYVRVNPAQAEQAGVPVAEHIGRFILDVVGHHWHPLDLTLRTVIDTGEPVIGAEFTGETPGRPGEPRTWAASFFPAGRGVVIVTIEITAERAAADRATVLHRAERATSALLDAVFAAAPLGLAIYDTEGRWQRVNPALAELAGLPADALLGRRPGEVLGPIGEQIDAAVREVARGGADVIERELAGAHAGHGGTHQHRLATYFSIREPDGPVTAVGAVVRDVTRERLDDEERARLLRESLTTRAQAEAEGVRAEVARAGAELTLRRVAFLAGATERLVRTLDYEETLRELTRIAVPELADWCSIWLLEPGGGLAPAALAHTDPRLETLGWELARRWPARPDAIAGPGRVVRTGETELIAEVPPELIAAAAHDEEHRRLLETLAPRSSLTVPLRPSGRTLGAMVLVDADTGRTFGPDDVTLAEALAARGALALDNARLYTERSRIADVLQRSLLPAALPRIPGVETAVRYRAAGEQNEVGGDFYDVYETAGEPDTWTAVVGDVAGKGAGAAALTSLSRHTLRAAALRGEGPIGQLELLNDALLARAGEEHGFVTVALARLRPDAEGTQVTLATGGHLPPVLVRADGTVELVEVLGALVGALAEPRFGTCELRLGPGDRLMLYTDGVVELRGAGGLAEPGEAALLAIAAEHARAPSDELARAVERHAVGRQGGEPRDDIAVLVLGAAPGA